MRTKGVDEKWMDSRSMEGSKDNASVDTCMQIASENTVTQEFAPVHSSAIHRSTPN